MDRHFRLADGADNICLLAAFADQIYANRLDCQTRAVFAYDERLLLLPDYLQQLEMESNGKSVTFTREADRESTRLNSRHPCASRMPSSARKTQKRQYMN